MIRKRYGNDTETIRKRYGTDRRKVFDGDGMEGRVVFIAKLFEWVILHLVCWRSVRKNASGFPIAKLEGYGLEKKSLLKKHGNHTEFLREPYGTFPASFLSSHTARERGGNAGSAEISWEQVSCEKTASGKLISKKGGCFTKEKEGGEEWSCEL